MNAYIKPTMTVLDPINRYNARPVPELTPVHEAYKLASSQEPVTWSEMADKYMEDLDHMCIPKWVYILSIFAGEDHDIWA